MEQQRPSTRMQQTTTRSRRTRGIISSVLTLTACFSVSQSATPLMVQVGDRGDTLLEMMNETNSNNNPFLYAERFKEFRAKAKRERKEKFLQRKKSSPRSFLQKLSSNVHTHTLEQINATEVLSSEHRNYRQLNWFGGSGAGAYSSGVLADPTEYYDKWAQAYRMLGGYIDCDHDKSDGSHDSGDNNNNGGGEQNSACSRWMLWASYVNPNYQGNEYDEYFSDNPTSVLDCHSPDTDWVLLGVYRQEFYQFIEQISKHLWAIDEYQYVVALAGLAYMTDYDCFQVGNDNNGNAIYAGVDPQPFGKFEMALYTDSYCLEPDTSLDVTFDDYGLTSNVQLSSGDEGDDNYGDSEVYDWWTSSQEYTLTNLNEVYEEFKYCTSCVDYPTYQDGYFIGDYGTDDDDLINQCWKFYSHDSFTCEAECIAMAHAQGNILSIKYGDTVFGKAMNGFYSKTSSESGGAESKLSRLLANSFLGISFVLFITTFLAFAVARRSRYRDRSSRSRRLLDGEQRSSSRRSKSRSKRSSSSHRNNTDDDGLFRSSTRSKSRSRKASSSSKRKKSSKSREREGASF